MFKNPGRDIRIALPRKKLILYLAFLHAFAHGRLGPSRTETIRNEAAKRTSKLRRFNSTMIGNIKVNLKEVRKFDELDPREPMREQ